MSGFTTRLKDAVKSLAGHPVELEHVLKKFGDISVNIEQPKNVDANGVIHWAELGMDAHHRNTDQGWVRGWRLRGGEWQSYDYHSHGLSELCVEDVEENWICDIGAVEQLSDLTPELKEFTSLNELAQKACAELIENVSEEGVNEIIACAEIRIIHQESSKDHFRRFAWDGRIQLINQGGSRHFAAARYIAGELNATFQLSATIQEMSLKPKAVHALHDEFDMFPVKNDPAMLEELMEALRAFGAEFCFMDLPSPFVGEKVIMLPKVVDRSVKTSKFLAQAGLSEMGSHLADLCGHQTFVL